MQPLLRNNAAASISAPDAITREDRMSLLTTLFRYRRKHPHRQRRGLRRAGADRPQDRRAAGQACRDNLRRNARCTLPAPGDQMLLLLTDSRRISDQPFSALSQRFLSV